jgi:hypothetical protein
MAGAACRNSVATASCVGNVQTKACWEAFKPNVPFGGGCRATTECLSGKCTGLTPCSMTCQGGFPVGTDCSNSYVQCDDSSWCKYDYPLPTYHCAPLVPIGQKCTGVDCVVGAFCPANRVCTAAGAPGAACPFTGDTTSCQSGSICDQDYKCAIQGAEGASCNDYLDCQLTLSCVGGKPGVCRSAGGQQGDPCSFSSCAADLFCDLGINRCQPRLPRGSACQTGDDICEQGFTCVQQVCVPIRTSDRVVEQISTRRVRPTVSVTRPP